METIKPSPRWGDDRGEHSSFHMIDVGGKQPTRRRAIAQGSILLAREAYLALRDGKNPKGNVLALAEVAGIMAAKKTSEIIPLCHPLPLHYVHLKFELLDSENRVIVLCEAGTTAQTGVEMEVLAGVNGALLTIYDLSKAVDPVITISEVRLNLKEGGKSGTWVHPQYQPRRADSSHRDSDSQTATAFLKGIRTSVVTISDRVSQGKAEDRSGPALREILESHGAHFCGQVCVPDEVEQIQNAVHRLIRNEQVSLVVTTGGTGLSPRDVTPDALEGIAQRTIPGLGELLRKDGSRFIETAWLSRSLACVIDQSLVIALPGSRNAVCEGIIALLPLLPHAFHIISGRNHDSVR